MLNHNAVFREELRKVGSAINKKYVVLRKEILKVAEVFDNQNLPIFPYEVCFGLFRQIPQTSSVSACLIFFPFLQNVVNLGFANEEMTREIITLLTHVKSMPKFHNYENEVKLQQILFLLVSKNTLSLANLPYNHSIINILLSLQNHRYKNVWTKSLSIISQISHLYIKELEDNPTALGRDKFLSYLSDVAHIARGDTPKWLLEPLQPYIFMSILSDILQEEYIKENKAKFGQILCTMMLPLRKFIIKLHEGALYQIPTSPSKHWQLPIQIKLVICLRVSCKISRLFQSSFQILEELIKIITEKGHPGLKILGYESINYLFSSSLWMHSMLLSPSCDLFNFLMTTLFNTVKMLQPQLKESVDLLQKFELDKSQRILTHSGLDFHCQQFSYGLQIKCLVKNIDQITFTFFSIYSDVYKLTLDKKLEEKPPLQKTYKFCHKTIFEIQKAIIGRQISEQTLQSLLKVAERFINLAGVFGDNNTAGMFTKLMCRHCLPAGTSSIANRHVQINKMILNTANCLGNLFSTGCWVTVWKALENYSLYYNRYLLGKEELQAERENDVQILYASMESIFTQSPTYEDKYLLNILQSLVEVTYQCLENTYSEQHRKIFAFQRIEQIFKLNLFRVQKIWHGLMSSLLILTTSKVQYFRFSSLALIDTLIPLALHYLHTHKEALGERMTLEDYESVILQPWANLAVSPFQEIRAQLAIAVGKLVIDYGHIMSHGWKNILGVVRSLQDLTSLQAIIQTFLDKIHPYIMEVIDIIDQVQRSLSDSNQKYLCLTLIWSIGDHAHQQCQSDILRKIYALLLQPEEMFVLGTEARHSSFYILAELLVHNCNQKQEEFWAWIFSLIEQFYNYSVDKCDSVRDKLNFEEILKNLLANLLKIFRKCFILLQQGHEVFIKSKLSNLFGLISRFISFRQSQIYQSTLKQMREMLALKHEMIMELQQYDCFLLKLTEIYYIEDDNKILKSLITYLPIDIYDILVRSFSKIPKKLGLIYKLVEKIFLLRLEAEEKDIKIHQMRIFFEQKIFLQFWRKFNAYILELNDEAIVKDYLQMLIKTLHKLILYEDYLFLSKMLPYLNTINERYCAKLGNEHTIDLYAAVLKLKWSQNWKKQYGKSKDVPIWLIASNQAVKLGYLLEKESEKSVLSERSYRKFLNSMSLIVTKAVTIQEQQVTIDYLTYYYDSECSLLYFLLQNYLLHPRGTAYVTPQQQATIHGVIVEMIQNFKQNDKTAKTKNVYDILFKSIANRSNLIPSIIVKQTALTKLFLLKITSVFNKYLKELSDKKAENSDTEWEVKFILKKLAQLQINAEVYTGLSSFLQTLEDIPRSQSPIMKSSRAALFILNSYFIRCIKTPSLQVRVLLCDILTVMNQSLLNEICI